MVRSVAERLMKHVEFEPNSGCWLWNGCLSTNGYAKINRGDGVIDYAHRVSYEIHVGDIPFPLELDHLCRTRSCINPKHLEAVTHQENNLRGMGPALSSLRMGGKTHCKSGHEFTPENTLITYGRGKARRTCRKCKRYWESAAYKAEKQAKC